LKRCWRPGAGADDRSEAKPKPKPPKC